MKPEPLKGKEIFNKRNKPHLYYGKDIKSAVEWREKEFRRKIAEMVLNHMQGEGDLFSLGEICDLSKEITNEAFEDVTKNTKRDEHENKRC